MMTNDYFFIDTGGFIFSHVRQIDRNDIAEFEEHNGSCSSCCVPISVKLKSGEVVRGTYKGCSTPFSVMCSTL
jgi:hypothetical protein